MTASPATYVMQSLDSLKVTPVWVDPNHLVESARVLMDGHDLSAICVLDRDNHPIGTLRRDVAANLPGNAQVGEVMEPVLGILDIHESLRQAADLLVRIDRDYAPLVRGKEYRGMVTALDLLDGLRRSWDPMTDLPWSDELRRWGAEKLDSGFEIAVVFIDLDRFGTFNKRFGHVVGDRVLTRIADFLRNHIDPKLDVLVRYGGDEFAIGTLRTAAETQALADSLLRDSREAPLRESGESISFSVGVYGGQRTRERDDIHVQATLDDLINLASRRCVASKQGLAEAAQTGRAVVAPPGGQPSVPVAAARALNEESSERVQDAEAGDAPELLDAPYGAPATAATEPANAPSATLENEGVPQEAASPSVAPASDQTPPAETPELSEEIPSVVEVQIEDDPNSLTHVVLKGSGRVWVGVGLRLGRSLESTIAYATGKALERAYVGRTLRIDAVREESGQVVVEGTKTENGTEHPVRAVARDNSPEAVADATIAAFLA